MTLLALLCSVAFPTLHKVADPTKSSDIRLQREAQLFFQQFEQEMNQASEYDINNGILCAISQDGLYCYEQYRDIVRRRKDGTGHFVMAQYVESINFERINSRMFNVELHVSKDDNDYKVNRLISLKIGDQPINETQENGE